MNGIGTKQFEPKTGFVPETVPPRMSYEDWLAWDYESGLT